MGIVMKKNKAGKMVPATVTQKRAATSGFRKTKKAAGKRTRQEIYDEADFYSAKRRGSGIFTPKEQKRVNLWKAAQKERDRNKKVQSNRVKKASKRTVKRSKGYA